MDQSLVKGKAFVNSNAAARLCYIFHGQSRQLSGDFRNDRIAPQWTTRESISVEGFVAISNCYLKIDNRATRECVMTQQRCKQVRRLVGA